MTKMAAMPIFAKNLKDLLLRNQWTWILKSITVCDLKVVTCWQLIVLMKVCEHWRSISCLDPSVGSFTYENFQIPLGHFEPKTVCKLLGTRKWKFITITLVTWSKWPPGLYTVKSLQNKLFSLFTLARFLQNLLCSFLGLQLIIVCANNDPWLTLTYFTASSNFVS